MGRRHWSEQAENWLLWARTPDHDAYWQYHEAFFDELVPAPGGRALDVGCGEGRTTRDLSQRGHRAIGIDASPTLVGHARVAHEMGEYVVAVAEALPFPDDAFRLVIAYNSLMDFDDMPRAVREAARVLQPGGHLCVCITHPFTDAGRFLRREGDAPFVAERDYLHRRPFNETFERNGLSITFGGWCYPLEEYARAFEESGLLIEAVREPPVPDAAVRADPAEHRWRRFPMFLFLRLVKRDAVSNRGSADRRTG